MKTAIDLKEELKSALENCNHVNNGSIAAQVNENIQWAWENWGDSYDYTEHYEGEEKPESYTESFRDEWIENEDFDIELEMINSEE